MTAKPRPRKSKRTVKKQEASAAHPMTYGLRLERVLQQRGILQSDLAQKLQISRAAVSQWIQGKTIPTRKRSRQIIDALELTDSELESGEPASKRLSTASPRLEVKALDLPEFSMDGAMSRDQNNPNIFTLDETKAKRAAWRVPPEVIQTHASSTPRPIVVRVQGNAMAPMLAAGDYVIVDRNWTDISPPGVYLINEGQRLTFWRCERLLGENSGLVRVSSVQGGASAEVPVEKLRPDVLGRVIFKLLTPF